MLGAAADAFDQVIDEATAPRFADRGTEAPRERIVRTGMQSATSAFDVGVDGDRIDPLQRLFDPLHIDRFWHYEYSHIGEMPGKLHKKQLEMLHNPAVHRWSLWGNQTGKTTVGAVDMVLSALGRHPLQLAGLEPMPPFTGWASALNWELWEKILLPELLSWIPVWRLVDSPPPLARSTKRDVIITADNGTQSRITGKAAEQGPAAYQSARVNKVWLDEEHPEEVWNEMQPRLLRYHGRTIATMTPLLGMTWVYGRMYAPSKAGQLSEKRHFYSHAGVADNPGVDEESLNEMKEELKNNPSQLESRLHGHFTRPEGAVLPWDTKKHQTEEDISPDDTKMLVLRHRGAWYGTLDLGKWRFHFTLSVANSDGELLLLDEYFSQGEDVDVRAKGIDALCKKWRVPTGDAMNSISIPADCADPKGISDLNEAFERIGSKISVYPIDGELKNVKAGINRCESMLNRGAVKVRLGMGHDMLWYLGRSSNKKGHPVYGSRWKWEIANWQYVKTEDGKIQKDEPDDKSADGADAMDGFRYLIMQFFPADAIAPKRKKNPTIAERLQRELEDMDQQAQKHTDAERFGGTLHQG